MAAQNHTKNLSAETILHLWCLLPQNPSNPISQLSWFSRPNRRLLENQKVGGSKELFLPEDDFKTCSAVNFPKNHADFGGPETN